MEYKQIRVVCHIDDLEQVCAVMSMVDNGLMIEDYSDIDENLKTMYGDLIDEQILNADKTKAAVSIFIPDERNPAEALSHLKTRFLELEIQTSVQVIGVKEEDWAGSWKKYYKPLRIGERLVVVPAWEKYDEKPGDLILKMDPGMAFGTGTHETTRLVAMLIEKYVKQGDVCLDLGTGSGILAIAASKLGAKSVNAYDIDPVAVRVAGENVRDNGIENIVCGKSDLFCGVEEKTYDLICANIVADIIIRMLPDVKKYLKSGGILITSGIIDERADEVLKAAEATPLVHLETREEKNWCAMVFKMGE
ncbi:MAG: 50S ribosomal protein L11 methyltransferase [Clostridia bacterium]|nr:50S ribosomal protein L11 methyltransferase [Clostridia bacterium]